MGIFLVKKTSKNQQNLPTTQPPGAKEQAAPAVVQPEPIALLGMVLNPRVLSQAMTQGLSGSPQKTHLE
jgi:hypothetical protein